MIEERFVGSIDSPGDRKKLRWLAPPILIAFVILGTAIDASNGILTTSGPGVGVLVGTPVAASVVEYSINVRVRRRFGIPIDENYQDSGALGRWFIIFFTETILCTIVGMFLYFAAGLLLTLVVGIGSVLLGTPNVGVDKLFVPAIFLSGIVTSTFLPDWVSDDEWDKANPPSVDNQQERDTDASEANVETPSSGAASTDRDSVGKIREKLATAEEHIEHGRFASARSTLEQIDPVVSEVDEQRDKANLNEKKDELLTRLVRAQAYERIQDATEALESKNTDAAENALEDVEEFATILEQYDPDAGATIQSDLNSLRERLEKLRERKSKDEADKRLIALLGSLGSARSQIEELLADGQHEKAAQRAVSALDTAEKAERLNETHDLKRGDRLAEVRSELEQLKHDTEAAQAEEKQIREQYVTVRDALATGDISRALDGWRELEPKSTGAVEDARTIQSLEAELIEQVEESRQELIRNAKQDLSVASSQFDGSDYENAQERARKGLEVCEDIRSLNESFDVEAKNIDDLETELEQLSGQVDTVLSAVDEADTQRRAVERALQSRDHEAVENALEELEHQVDILVANDADEEIVADLRTSANDLRDKLAVGQADGRVTGLLGSAMSSYSTAAKLLEDEERERSLRRLESARESLNEASNLNQEYALGRSDSIQEKQEKVSELLGEANEAPKDTLHERLVAAESAVARGIDAREAGAVDSAVEAFTDALDTYEEARELAAENDLDAIWEVEQRLSMTEEYLEVARSELETRQHAVRKDLNQILEDGESTLVTAEQHVEVNDTVSAREAFEETTSMLDDAAKLIETGLATGNQEDRHEALDKRANNLESRLPESSTGEYRNRDLINALQRLTIKLEESPRPEFVNEYAEYPADAYLTAFGTWSDALAAANLDPIDETTRERRTYSRTEVLDALVDLTDELGYQPSRTEMNQKGTVSSTTVKNRFRDWETALELAETSQRSDEPEAEQEESRDSDEFGKEPETTSPESTDEAGEEDILGQIENELSDL